MNTLKISNQNLLVKLEGTFAGQGFYATYERNEKHPKGSWSLIEVTNPSLNVDQDEWEEAFFDWLKFRVDPNNGSFAIKSSLESLLYEERS